jgi:hypothetical protein
MKKRNPEVKSANELERIYSVKNPVVAPFSVEELPEKIRQTYGFILSWGISDDYLRARYIDNSQLSERKAFVDGMQSHYGVVAEWLASLTGDTKMVNSPIYRAASAMMLAYEEIKAQQSEPGGGIDLDKFLRLVREDEEDDKRNHK